MRTVLNGYKRSLLLAGEKRLMSAVRDALELNLVRFQSGSGVSIEGFLAVLDFYLQSTVIEYNACKYVQKEGVCIGSSVAPILAEIYLNSLDAALSKKTSELTAEMCFVRRYVDDIIVCTFKEGLSEAIEALVKATAPELQFTVETPKDDVLEFLDLRIQISNGLCWEYGKETVKPILPKQSCHSKNVKAGIAKSLIGNALSKSCTHFLSQALKRQWTRLQNAGYEDTFIRRQLTIQLTGKQNKQVLNSRRAVIPYFHDISHNLKASAKKFGIETVCTADFKLCHLTPFESGQKKCQKEHRDKSVPCEGSVVYEIPLECGFKYVGQTSRCLNDRLTEHKRNVRNNASNSELARHLQECRGCKAVWSKTEVICKEKDDMKRVVQETVCIKTSGNCISQASLQVGNEAKRFLRL